MGRKIPVICISLIFLCTFRPQARPSPSPETIRALYRRADSLFRLAHPTTLTDSLARITFREVIAELESSRAQDTLLFPAYIKIGVLADVRGNYAEAIRSYRKALGCFDNHRGWSDSLLFQVYVYAGPDYYHENAFDSAYGMLSKAEMLVNRYHGLPDQDRLYNALGALYFESGNYQEGMNCFEHALGILQQQHPSDRSTAISFKSNIATCLYKLGEYKDALEKYMELLRFGQFSNQLYLNVGKAYVALNDYSHALEYYRRIKPGALPSVLNEMGYAQFLMGRRDSALYYLDTWRKLVKDAGSSNLDAGNNELFRAEILMDKGLYEQAIRELQKSIITFSGTFNDNDFHANPTNFIGSFASYRLFDALSFKADALSRLYGQSRREEFLKAASSAYTSAIHLFGYIEKNYTTDDARLFLKNNNSHLYQNAFLTCLELNRLHPGGNYLEEAFLTAEKSKASIVSGGRVNLLSERIPGINPYFLQKERTLKYNIARLELLNNPEGGGPAAQAAVQQKADYEIELALIQKNMELNSSYYKFKYEDRAPGIRDLQAGLNRNQALISMFVSPYGLHVFTLTRTSFGYMQIDSVVDLLQATRACIDMLGNTQPGFHYGNTELEQYLSRRLIRPLLDALPGKEEWIVIPDNIFNLLPLDALPVDQAGDLLVDKVAVSYQLSSKFMAGPFGVKDVRFDHYSVLAFAPFAEHDQWVNAPTPRLLNQLPESGLEISGFPGQTFFNDRATKANFLKEANRYPVIDLATHAVLDERGQGSCIAFYPRGRGPEEDCLSLTELYGLKLDSTALVILSACESDKGEIVANEGVMSLSRGFMYAGCGSTVGSLWRADDQSTEGILRQFQELLSQGYPKSEALRLAKLKYIHGNIFHTTPNYWAHLVLVGNTDAIVSDRNGLWRYLLLLLGLVILMMGVKVFISSSGSIDPKGSFS